MGKKQSQSGSVHLVIIIILILALVGTLSFVFWQNYVNKPISSSNSKTINSSKTQVTTPSTDTDNTKYFSITDWGIKGIYDGKYSLRYELKTGSNFNQIELSSSDVEKECQGRILYIISKYSATNVVGGHSHVAIDNPQTAEYYYSTDYFEDEMRKVGDSYYVLDQGVTDACPGVPGQTDIQTQVMLDIRHLFLTLQLQ